MKPFDFRDCLLREFELRKNRNAKYSLRAYARDLGMQPPKLSQVLKGTCGLSVARGTQIAKKLNLSPEEKKLFLCCLEAKFSRSQSAKDRAQKKLEATLNELQIALEQFRLIADWHHFALLELLKIHNVDQSPAALAQRLGVDKNKIQSALDRLETLGMLERKNNSYVSSNKTFSTTHDIPSKDIQEHHRQVIGKSLQALENVNVKERDFSTMTMALSESQIPEAKKFINDFKDQFDLRFGQSESADRVYALGIQFFPLDKKTKKENL